MRTFRVDREARLLDYLFQMMSDTPKTRVRQLLKFESIVVNDAVTTQFDTELHPGDRVCIRSLKPSQNAPVPQFGIKIIFEDEDIVVIEKPEDLLTISTEKVSRKTAFFGLNDYLNERELWRLKKFNRKEDQEIRKKQIFIVHRLDRETSGLLVFAKNVESKCILQDRWMTAEKRYFAVVHGTPKEDTGTITSYLHESKTLKVYSGPNTEDAKQAVTHYRVLRAGADHSLLEIELETGRKHQIRVHLSDLGHPVVGDKRYGDGSDPIKRLGLHAHFLALIHPVSEKRLVFESPMPKSFEQIL